MSETYSEIRKICRSMLKKFGKQIKKKNDIQSFSLKWEKRKKRKITQIISYKYVPYVGTKRTCSLPIFCDKIKIHRTFDTKVLASKKSTFSACIDEK